MQNPYRKQVGFSEHGKSAQTRQIWPNTGSRARIHRSGAQTRRTLPNADPGTLKHRFGSPNTPDLAKHGLQSTKTPFGEPKHAKLGQIQAPEPGNAVRGAQTHPIWPNTPGTNGGARNGENGEHRLSGRTSSTGHFQCSKLHQTLPFVVNFRILTCVCKTNCITLAPELVGGQCNAVCFANTRKNAEINYKRKSLM